MIDSDLDLVRRLQDGSDAALEAIMLRHREPIFRFVYRHVGNAADAEEIAQETFVRVYFAASRFRPSAKFSTWLYQIALNLCRDHQRRRFERARAMSVPLDRVPEEQLARSADPSRRPDRELETQDSLIAVQQAITELPLKWRTPLILVALEGLSLEETGRILRVSAKAVEMRLYRARRLLWRKMSEAGLLSGERS